MVAVIPMNERGALRDTTLPKGGGPDGPHAIFVRKGIQILIPFYAIQHRPDIWGEDAELFRPERWEGRKIRWEWTPFGGGPRKCLCRKCSLQFFVLFDLVLHNMDADSDVHPEQFGLTESAYLIVRFLQRFDACENMEGPGEIKLHTAIENRSGTGVKVRFREATPR